MRFVQLIVVIGFVVVQAAWAGDQAASSPVSPATPASSASAHGAGAKLDRSQAEVKRLKQDVGKQESDSQRASERLQQQDQAIAELRKQLQTLQATPAAKEP